MLAAPAAAAPEVAGGRPPTPWEEYLGSVVVQRPGLAACWM